MTDLKRMQPERRGKDLPETYSDIWAEAARAAYPDHEGHNKADFLAMLTPGAKAEAAKLPALAIDIDEPKPGVDPALELDQIGKDLRSDDFSKRQDASMRLGKVLPTEIARNKPSAALQKILQLAGSDDAEARARINQALNPVFDEAMDSKDLAGLKQLLTHREGAVRDWAIKKLQDSPKLVETVPKLASMAEKEKNTDLAEAIRKVAEPIDQKVLFQDVLLDGVWGSEWTKIFREAGSINLSKMKDDKERADAIQRVLRQVTLAVTTADDMQTSDLGALARLLNTPGNRMPHGPDMPNLVQAAPFESRTIVSRALIMMADELKDAKKDSEAVDTLQAAAISLYKELMALPVLNPTFKRTWRDPWAGALKDMRVLNPEQFDRLVPDKLIQEPRRVKSEVND